MYVYNKVHVYNAKQKCQSSTNMLTDGVVSFQSCGGLVCSLILVWVQYVYTKALVQTRTCAHTPSCMHVYSIIDA